MSNNQGLPRHLQDGAHSRRNAAEVRLSEAKRTRREPAQGLMSCEICGATGKVFETQIDGATMYACERCAGDNKKDTAQQTLARPFVSQKSSFAQKSFEEPEFVAGFGKKIRQAREEKKITIFPPLVGCFV